MTLNEALIRQNFIAKILLRDGENELSKLLKVKIMSMRIALTKIRTQFDKDCQDAILYLKPEGFDELIRIQEKTEEQENELKIMTDKLNEEYNAFLIEKGKEEVTFDKMFTQDEYDEIVEVNGGNDVTINENTITSADFLEIIHGLFVESI